MAEARRRSRRGRVSGARRVAAVLRSSRTAMSDDGWTRPPGSGQDGGVRRPADETDATPFPDVSPAARRHPPQQQKCRRRATAAERPPPLKGRSEMRGRGSQQRQSRFGAPHIKQEEAGPIYRPLSVSSTQMLSEQDGLAQRDFEDKSFFGRDASWL